MKNWAKLEESSFFTANARERALGMADRGSFTELLGPRDRCRCWVLRWSLTTAR